MKKAIARKSLLVAGILLCSHMATAGEFTVVPGHSLGRIWLGAPYGKTRKIMGKPYLIERDGALTIEFWRVPKSNGGYISAVYEHNRVIQLETNSPRFSTSRGVSAFSTLEQIRKVFKDMRVVSFGTSNSDPDVAEHAAHYYDSTKQGIAFELDLGAQPDISAGVTPYNLLVHRPQHRVLSVAGQQVWAEDEQK